MRQYGRDEWARTIAHTGLSRWAIWKTRKAGLLVVYGDVSINTAASNVRRNTGVPTEVAGARCQGVVHTQPIDQHRDKRGRNGCRQKRRLRQPSHEQRKTVGPKQSQRHRPSGD